MIVAIVIGIAIISITYAALTVKSNEDDYDEQNSNEGEENKNE